MRYLLPINRTLIVRGPATLRLISGHATILGASLGKSSSMVIQPDKQLPIESEDEAEIDITFGRTGTLMEMEGSSLPESWKDVVNSLASMGRGIAMIIGPSDVGKSTLCTYVMNALINRRCNVRVLDADIGQADIGPPTTIASSTPTLPRPTLAHLEPEKMFFVGHNTPSFVQTHVLSGIKRILNSDYTGVTIINTDGWVNDSAAILYKNCVISIVNPDILVGIGPRSSLNPILQATKSYPIMLESSPAVLPRTRNERKEIRRIGYQRFLTNSTSHTLKLEDVRLRLRRSISKRNLDMSNVILGFLNAKGFMDQIGILETISHSHLTVYSRAIHQHATIEFGYVRLARNGLELGFLE